MFECNYQSWCREPMVVITVNEYNSELGNVHVLELVEFEPIHPSRNASTIFCWYSDIRESTLIQWKPTESN